MAGDSSLSDDLDSDHPVLQRERTLAIVFGASEWPFYPDFHDAPSFRHSAHEMADYLRSPAALNLPARNVKVLFDSFDPAPEILEQMWEFVRTRRADLDSRGMPASDLLLYYVGHGGFSDSDVFFLSTRSTNEDDPLASSITAESLGRLVREGASGLRAYVVLDCCFAASASKVFMSAGPVGIAGAQLAEALPPQGDAMAGQAGRLPAYGTALLCASGPREPAKAPADLPYTMFTGAVLEVLRQGDSSAPAWLSLDDMQRLVRARLEARFGDKAVLPQVHAPQQRKGRVDLVPLFCNPAHVARARPPLPIAEAERAGPAAGIPPAAPMSSALESTQPAKADRRANAAPASAEPVPIPPRSFLRQRRGWMIGTVLGLVVVGGVVWLGLRLAPGPAAIGNTNSPPVAGQASPGSTSPSVSATDSAYAAAVAEEKAGNVATAAAAYKALADKGNALAQLQLALLYSAGRGVPKSETDAAGLYKLSADQGNAWAQFYLGLNYQLGRGVPQSNTEAGRLYKLSADQGNATAETQLGLLYESGLGVPQSYAEAARLYKLGVDAGNAVAQNNLGLLYERGLGVAQSDTEAARLIKLSADQGDVPAETNLGGLYEAGRGGLSQSDVEAARLYRIAAEHGYARAQYNLGRLSESGQGVPQSRSDAISWYRLAARQGYTHAQGALRNLGESW